MRIFRTKPFQSPSIVSDGVSNHLSDAAAHHYNLFDLLCVGKLFPLLTDYVVF
jgi:hypothetical protein